MREMADAFISLGLVYSGYTYVDVDDAWCSSRDANGTLVADPTTFPSGMKSLADYIHAKGLKFGIYSSNSPLTCNQRPGSFGHEYQDAATFAEWGVDLLKYGGFSVSGSRRDSPGLTRQDDRGNAPASHSSPSSSFPLPSPCQTTAGTRTPSDPPNAATPLCAMPSTQQTVPSTSRHASGRSVRVWKGGRGEEEGGGALLDSCPSPPHVVPPLAHLAPPPPLPPRFPKHLDGSCGQFLAHNL
jgi:hypothetical protein